MKVVAKRSKQFKGKVYNLETPENHTYYASGVLVHNCYQSSTTKGSHAGIDYIESVLYGLKELEVFECALGGGEPTSHPDFLRILREGARYNLTMNFTTKSLKWLEVGQAEDILNLIGGFAYSINNRGDIINLQERIDGLIDKGLRDLANRKASCQLVMGTIDRKGFEEIVRTCSRYNLRLTLLGFKGVGFGITYPAQDYSWWVDVLKEEEDIPKVGIDTQLAKHYQRELNEAGIPKYMYSVLEGQNSCYIDCVAKKMAPSSYCHPELYKDLRYPMSEIEEIWEELEVV